MRAIVLLCLLPVALCTTPNYSWDPQNDSGHKQDSYLMCYDQTSCGCCLMERMMGRMEMYFDKSVEGMHKLLNESKKKLIDMRASRSAFSVALNNNSALTCFGPFENTAAVVIYRHVFLNLGGGYNMRSGVFTVPRSGVYSFALTVYGRASTNNTLAACATLRVNGTAVTALTENGMEDREDSATVVAAVELKAGDMVDVVLPPGCSICDNTSHFNTFTGFLLYSTDHKSHTSVA